MRMDRLEVELAGEDEVIVVQLGVALECRLKRDAHRVLHEAWLQMRMLDDEELVRPLQELVDRRAHRALDDSGELLGIHRMVAPDVEGAPPALVMRRDRDELEDSLDVGFPETGLEQPP